MKWLREWWRDIVDYVKWCISVDDEPIAKEFEEVCDKATKYERLEKHFPDEIAQMNATLDEKERNVHES